MTSDLEGGPDSGVEVELGGALPDDPSHPHSAVAEAPSDLLGPLEPNDDATKALTNPGDKTFQTAGLAILAVLSVLGGYFLGRMLRSEPVPPPVQTFDPAAVPTFASVPIGGDHPLVANIPPGFALTDIVTGEQVSLADYAGRPVLVNFWATWCPPCRLEMPWLQTAYDRHKDAGLAILAVNAGERLPADQSGPAIKAFTDSYGLTFPVLHGQTDALQSEWGVWGLPASFMIDRSGRVADAQIGMYASQDDLESRLSALMGPN